MQVLKAGILYFVLVFATGFVLGPVRVLWLVPRVGERSAELIEMPFMLVAIVLAAWWTVRRLHVSRVVVRRLGMGLVALGLLLAAEFTFVLWLRGLAIADYLAGRDPVSGAVYLAMLGVFAVMPLLVARK